MSSALSILGAGAVTPVGLSAPQACAAVRARISGFRERLFFAPSAEPTVCAEVPARARLKQTSGDWLVHLATRAISECIAGHELKRSRLAVLLTLPDSYRRHPALEQSAPDGILPALQARLGFALSAASEAVSAGHAASLSSLLKARDLLSRGEVDLCLVGGVDSMLNRQDIERLEECSRLRSTSNPQGVIPGEGAAFLLLGSAAKPRTDVLAQILGIGLAIEKNTILGERFATGEGLRAALEAAARDSGCVEADLGLRVSDMNGERYRAWDSMVASMRF